MLRVVGRYAIFDELAHGGMATVHVGRLRGAAGFARTVAIKRLHTQYARDPAFVSMLVDEARFAARIKHPNVVPVLDVVMSEGELFLVMDYVVGETVSRLIVNSAERETRVPIAMASAIMSGALLGLHAAHEATSEYGEPLGIVHRDVSPQNVMVGVDGVARVFDFGVAKAAQRSQTTHDGALKGKIGYMSPEQLHGEKIDRRSDIYAAGVVLWEALVGERLFLSAEGQPGLLLSLTQTVKAPSLRAPGLSPVLDDVVLRALARDPAARFPTAFEMARAIEECVEPATPAEVGAWVRDLASDALATKARLIARIESVGELSPLDQTGEMPIAVEDPTTVDQEPIAFEPETLPVLQTPSSRSEGRARRRWIFGTSAVLFGVFIGLFGAWLVSLRAPSSSAIDSSAAVPSSAPFIEPSSTPVPSEPMTSSAPTAPPVDSGAAAETPATAPPTAPSASVRRPPPRPPPPLADCNPPFTLDEQGHKRYKRHCFP